MGTSYEIELVFSSDMCIEKIENLKNGENIVNENENNHLQLDKTITIEKGDICNYKVVMACGIEEIKTFKVDDFIPKDN